MTSQVLFQQAPVGFALVERQGYFIQANPHYCALVGYTEEELKARNFQSITYPEDLESDVQKAEQLYREEIPSYELEKRYLRKDQSVIWVKLTCSLIRDQNSSPLGLAVAQDITLQKKAELAYRESQQTLVAALNASKTGIFRWNIQNNTLTWHANLSKLFGRPEDTDVHWFYDFIALVHPEDQAQVLARCHESEQLATDFEMEYRTIWPDNSIHWIYSKGTTFLDKQNHPSYMMGACVDVTERKQAELTLKSSEEHFRFVTDAAPVMLWLTDEKHSTTFVNQTWRVFTGQSSEELMGFGWLNKIHPDDREKAGELFVQAADKREKFSIEYRLLRKDGVYRHILDSGAPIIDLQEHFSGYIGYALDITERKEMEQNLAETGRKLSQSNHDLEQFAAVASHDLQAPLRKVAMFTDMVYEQGKDKLDADILELMQRVQRAVNSMQTLIHDLLSLAKMSEENAHFEQVNLNSLLTEVLTNLSSEIGRTGAIIEAGSLGTVYGDASQLAQLLQNLLQNAIKYQPENQQPVIKIESVFQNQQCQISIRDNGIGFPQEQVERIFKPFERLHGKTSPYSGTGIGLTICQRIVERHHGVIQAYSEQGKGATFQVTLPLCQESSTAATPDVEILPLTKPGNPG